MKSVILAAAVIGALGLTGCNYFSSPEKTDFDAFLAKCKANPELADCKAAKENNTSPTN